MSGFVYIANADGTFTTGFFKPTGAFINVEEHKDRDSAAAEVNYLNGGSDTRLYASFRAAVEELEQARQELADLTKRLIHRHEGPGDGRCLICGRGLDHVIHLRDDQ